MIDYQGKVVLVTGGASGIGLAMAELFQKRGARVVIADVNAAAIEEAVARLGSGVTTLQCDLAAPGSASRLIDDAHRVHGALDVVCSNAGIGHRKKVLEEPFGDSVTRLFEINFFAGLRLAQSFHALLERDGKQGRMLFTASENSLSVPSAIRGSGIGLYAASKHALLIAAEWMRDEMARGPLSLHVLLPGAVYTPLIAKRLPDPSKAPAALDLIMPERCAEIALRGMDLGLFYIPTQAHLADDMRARSEGVIEALRALQIRG